MFDFGSSPFGGGSPSLGGVPLSNIEALITKFGIGQQQPQQPQIQRTIINDLDELFADMTTDQRRAVEGNEEYMMALGNLLQKYLLFSLGHTSEGVQFVSTHGKKLAQNLLDTAKKVSSNVVQNERNEMQSMSERMQQLEQIIAQQRALTESQASKIQELEQFKANLGD